MSERLKIELILTELFKSENDDTIIKFINVLFAEQVADNDMANFLKVVDRVINFDRENTKTLYEFYKARKLPEALLDKAINFDKIDIVKTLNEFQKVPVNKLFAAVEKNALNVVTWLVEEQKADVNMCNDDLKLVPLYVAANAGSYEVAEYLLSKGASVNGREDAVLGSPLCIAVRNGYLEVAELLISHEADVNASGASGKAPLHEAVKTKNLDACRLLLSHGANKDIKVKVKPGADSVYEGKTPLEIIDYRVDDEPFKIDYLELVNNMELAGTILAENSSILV